MIQQFQRLNTWFHSQSAMIRIIVANIVVFLALHIVALAGGFSGHPQWIDAWLGAVELPGSPARLLHRPWTLLTYMFVQYDLFHIIFNMLWLYWFGTIFMQFNPSWRLTALYIYGGIAGAAVFILCGLVDPTSALIGASAAVIAIVAATAMMMPHYRVQLILFGSVKLKWIAIITIGIDILSLGGSNMGGHIAHLGGAGMGVIYALALRGGNDLAIPFRNMTDALRRLFARRLKPSRDQRRTTTSTPGDTPSMATIDAILDKIKRSGYTSLTPEERAILFRAGNNKPRQ